MTVRKIGPTAFLFFTWDRDRLVMLGGVPLWIEIPLQAQWQDDEWVQRDPESGAVTLRAVNGMGIYRPDRVTVDGRMQEYERIETRGWEPYDPATHAKPWRTGVEQLADLETVLRAKGLL